MVRYIMSFTVAAGMQEKAQQIIDEYFESLEKEGPGGMRSQCYASNNDDCSFVHIKSFRKESTANQHFRSAALKEYLEKISQLSGEKSMFMRLMQQKSFESIY
jgi:hypothetical protein